MLYCKLSIDLYYWKGDVLTYMFIILKFNYFFKGYKFFNIMNFMENVELKCKLFYEYFLKF